MDAEAIDPLADDFCLLSDLINKLPHKPGAPVISRWVQQGVRGEKLRVLKISGRHMTTKREFARFLQTLTPIPEPRRARQD